MADRKRVDIRLITAVNIMRSKKIVISAIIEYVASLIRMGFGRIVLDVVGRIFGS